MNGNILYTAPTVECAEYITRIINKLFNESKKKSENPSKVRIVSELVPDVARHINHILGPIGWMVTESGVTSDGPYVIAIRTNPFALIPPVEYVGNNIYLNKKMVKEDLVGAAGVGGDVEKQSANVVKQTTSTSPTNKQVGGDHYKLPIQPIEYILANGLGYCEANVVKYVSRWRNKGGIQDLKKAIHYLEMLIESEEKANERPQG